MDVVKIKIVGYDPGSDVKIVLEPTAIQLWPKQHAQTGLVVDVPCSEILECDVDKEWEEGNDSTSLAVIPCCKGNYLKSNIIIYILYKHSSIF